MKKIFTFCVVVLIAASMWAYELNGNLVLDLKTVTVPETGFTYTAKGNWDKTFTEGIPYIESSPFLVTHLINSDSFSGAAWNGFTVCKTGDVYDYGKPGESTGWVQNQWGNIAGGGIKVDATGNIVKTAFGTPAVDKDQPYLLGYYGYYGSGEQTNQILFNDNNAYEVVGVFVTNASWPFYGCIHGDGFARAFDEGDSFKLVAHGVAEDGTEKTAEITLISYTDGMLHAIRNWKYWDLSSLGKVKSVYFNLTSTDASAYGSNTAVYFCLDKFMVKKPVASGVTSVNSANNIIYDRMAQTISLSGDGFGVIYNADGKKVMVVEKATTSVADLTPGVYVVKTASASKKFVK